MLVLFKVSIVDVRRSSTMDIDLNPYRKDPQSLSRLEAENHELLAVP
jgi:hypothetical protein